MGNGYGADEAISDPLEATDLGKLSTRLVLLDLAGIHGTEVAAEVLGVRISEIARCRDRLAYRHLIKDIKARLLPNEGKSVAWGRHQRMVEGEMPNGAVASPGISYRANKDILDRTDPVPRANDETDKGIHIHLPAEALARMMAGLDEARRIESVIDVTPAANGAP